MATKTATTLLLHEAAGTQRRCAECGDVIPLHTEYVRQDGDDLHPFCAGDAGRLETCQSCFMVDCDCDR